MPGHNEYKKTSCVLAVLGDVNARSAAAAVQEALSTSKRVECCVIFAGASGSAAATADHAGTGADSSAAASSPASPAAVTAGDINAVACLLDAVALSARPRLRCVPLLPAAGWSLERTAALPSQALLLPAGADSPHSTSSTSGASAQHAHAAAAEPGAPGGGRRDEGATASTSGTGPAGAVAAAAVAERLQRLRPAQLPAWQPPQQPPCTAYSAAYTTSYTTLLDGALAPPAAPLQFSRVAVGGTFDRLHAGHELLLAATALVAERFVFVGITADALLAGKSHRELLQPYDTRAAEALSYLTAVRPGLAVEAGPLSDPKAPTLAELDPAMQALVVSVETLPGARAINAGRAARGFAPLAIITVPVIGVRQRGGGGGGAGGGAGGGGGGGAGAGEKLSSSGLRAAEATLASASMDEGGVLGAAVGVAAAAGAAASEGAN
ncbi:hypothetical protein HXX76_001758 [Chlamydomonas incerta]|uniref:Cytidyltransferase-like domain-containing protein n=1 Tax=Chlamydomonas incerta TaxID=51695 RepID=A0A835TQE8_CHLIN|nr:hypothetical protein HXX76_001758 [Chlamydomonas incerta]|eukprot:KAG2443400.1 hypothetical protein HXX76_001758 [Chlamydomonas incerta]